MSIRDRWSSLLTGRFVEGPSDGPSADDEIADLRDEVVKLSQQVAVLLHDFRHACKDRDGAMTALSSAEAQIHALCEVNQMMEEKLVAAEAIILANGLAA